VRLIPQSLVGRALMVLLAGLAVSHAISLTLYTGDRSNVSATAAGRRVAEHIAGIVAAVEAAPSEARSRLVRSFWGPAFRVSLTADGPLAADGGGWRARQARAMLSDYLGGVEPERIRVAYRDNAPPSAWFQPNERDRQWMEMMGRHMPGMMGGMGRGAAIAPGSAPMPGGVMAHMWSGGEVLEVSLRLSDGSWLNFAAPPVTVAAFWRSPYFLSIVATTLVVIVLSVWALKRSTAPLAALASAADRLGRDVNAPPLAEDGPSEVRHAARAFNQMQRRLGAFIADRTQTLAAVSHDLRTPITRLKLRAEFIDDPEAQKKMLADLDEMEAMIAATLAFAADDASAEASAAFDLAALVQGLCDDARDRGGDAVYDGPAKFAFDGRPRALKRVFGNLIGNALKYGQRARVALAANDQTVTVTVADDGPGIPEAELEKVFQPFYRLERSRSRLTGGTGLGLAVVRSIARAHGGDVVLANRPEGGLAATVTLPRA
jgi:signal transduction histidine kinase